MFSQNWVFWGARASSCWTLLFLLTTACGLGSCPFFFFYYKLLFTVFLLLHFSFPNLFFLYTLPSPFHHYYPMFVSCRVTVLLFISLKISIFCGLQLTLSMVMYFILHLFFSFIFFILSFIVYPFTPILSFLSHLLYSFSESHLFQVVQVSHSLSFFSKDFLFSKEQSVSHSN